MSDAPPRRRLAISSIAWTADDEPMIAVLLHDRGIAGVEIAPTRIWEAPLDASGESVRRYRAFWESHDIRIVAMQALLFGREDLTIFGAQGDRDATLRYLVGIMELGRELGADAFVFGSPRNRRVGVLPWDEVLAIASDFFSAIADAAEKLQVRFCLEPNPREYGCDFLTTSREALDFVTGVDRPGLCLNLDAGAMTLAREDVDTAIAAAVSHTAHFHVSEPQLAPIGAGGVAHDAIAAALERHGYDGWISVEMRPVAGIPAQISVDEALDAAERHYRPLLLTSSARAHRDPPGVIE